MDDHHFEKHLFTVDQTLHWANPPGGNKNRDSMTTNDHIYKGPVPIVTHLHGGHTQEESDGHPESWYLPKASDIPKDYAVVGSLYKKYSHKYHEQFGNRWHDGYSIVNYPNDQRDGTLWYHDHALGITRINVYAGLAGFYLLRGNPIDAILDSRDDSRAILPGPAPGYHGQAPDSTYRELPLLIQDKTFTKDGELFFPKDRAFFENLTHKQLDIPFIPDNSHCNKEMSDVHPYWNPEFFGNTILVNGATWPYFEVKRLRHRFRVLNASNARTFKFVFSNNMSFWVIGSDGGYLNTTPVQTSELLMAPAERYDIIVDFSNVEQNEVILKNIGPDEPFNGANTNVADPQTTGLVMKFKISEESIVDETTPPEFLRLPTRTPIGNIGPTRNLSIVEMDSNVINVLVDANGNYILSKHGKVKESCSETAVPFGPTEALLGTFDVTTDKPVSLHWNDPITEKPVINVPEQWNIYNTTADVHPIHVHQVQFQVIGRQPFTGGTSKSGSNLPLPIESGIKDTIIAYPGEITSIKINFDITGLYVWHCHMLDHEDNELMRPLLVSANV